MNKHVTLEINNENLVTRIHEETLSAIEKLQRWLEFMILNQEQLKIEYKDIPYPEWNKGYLEALNDCMKSLRGNFN
jgi:hypothetical protein